MHFSAQKLQKCIFGGKGGKVRRGRPGGSPGSPAGAELIRALLITATWSRGNFAPFRLAVNSNVFSPGPDSEGSPGTPPRGSPRGRSRDPSGGSRSSQIALLGQKSPFGAKSELLAKKWEKCAFSLKSQKSALFHENHQKVHFLLRNEKMTPKTINIPLARATFSQGARKERKVHFLVNFMEKVHFSDFLAKKYNFHQKVHFSHFLVKKWEKCGFHENDQNFIDFPL